MRIFLSFLLCLCLLTPVKAQEEGPEAFRLLVFGNSLSAGYRLPSEDSFYTQLENAIHAKGYDNVTVINDSVSGETSSGGLARVKQALNYRPHAVLLELGINDAIQGEDVDKIQENLSQIISTFQENDIAVMLIGMMAPPTRGIQYREDFSKMYKDLSKEYNVILYPFFMDGVTKQAFGVYVKTYLQDDGAHPNAEGVKIMVKNIMPSVEKFLLQQ